MAYVILLLRLQIVNKCGIKYSDYLVSLCPKLN